MIRSDSALSVARALLRLLLVLNLVGVGLLVVSFAATFVFEGALAGYYVTRRMDAGVMVPTLRGLMVLGAPMMGAVHVLLSRLLGIVESVRAGQTFAQVNVSRLKTAARALLLVQVVHLGFGAIARIAQSARADIDWSFSVTGWLAVVLLFALARVFEEGTRLRDDVEAII